MLKTLVIILISALTLPAFADRCTGVIHFVASDDRSREAKSDSQDRCYQAAYQVGGYCQQPTYIGKVGSNNDAWETGLVFTRQAGSVRKACREVRQVCHQYATNPRDWCDVY